VNTYSHVLFTWTAARRLCPGRRRLAWFAAAGAGLPDVPYIARGARLLWKGGGRVKRREALAKLDYFSEPDWTPDLALHSLVSVAPVLAASGTVSSPVVRDGLRAMSLGWAAHNLVDLATHASDARPHLWPISSRRWRSPISYWERRSHALPVLILEHAALVAVAGWALRDPPRERVRPRPRLARVRDSTGLAASFLHHPRQVGALVPTSRRTVREMLDMTSWRGVERVVELGAGTGVYTEQLLERVGPDAQVLAFEIDRVLARGLEQRFADSRLRVICDSAENLHEYLNGHSVDVVVSALPFTTLPEPFRARIYRAIVTALEPAGMMLAIQYSKARQGDLQRLFSTVEHRWALHNVPPALLYACLGPGALTAGSS
jgi:phospholipid N-methyltransferase